MTQSDHGQDSDDSESGQEENEKGSSDKEDESVYNDGKGIQITATLIGLLPAPKAGDKRRANARPPVTTKVVYIHENTSFINGLVKIMWSNMKRKDLCKGGLDRHGNLSEKTATLFSLEYTVPRTQLKDIELSCERDWETFLDEAGKKPSAQGKLMIKEKLTAEATAAAKAQQAEESEDNEDTDKKKKPKKHIPTEEELNQDVIIKRLTEIHMCEDRKCTFSGPCWVDAESTAHIHLTHLHLRTWAAAIDSGKDGVDEQHPPNTKLFDSRSANASADVATMAKRRATAGMATAGSGGNVYVSFDGLADLLRGPGLRHETLAIPTAAVSTQQPNDVTKWPKMDLRSFCEQFDIPEILEAKLQRLAIQGPHVLSWIKDEDLRGEGQLILGELGTLRDAEQRWKNFCTWDN